MIRRRKLSTSRPCPFCGSKMQYSESGRYAEWTCTGERIYTVPGTGQMEYCQGHAEIPLAWQYSGGPAAGEVGAR